MRSAWPRCARSSRRSWRPSTRSTRTARGSPTTSPGPRSCESWASCGRRYGEGLDTQSHGESFLRFFGERLVPNGTYFLDEPEAPLSPARQLSFLALLKELVAADGQAIIATHSPILLAFPGAVILSFDGDTIAQVAYEDLDHVRLTRDFLADPEAFLRHL